VRGLGLLPYSNCVHYNAEPERRAEYHRFLADGMRAGFAADDGVALHFRRTRLNRVVSSRADARAYRVEHRAGGVVETPLDVRHLGDEPLVDEPAVLDDAAHHARLAAARRPRRRDGSRAVARSAARSAAANPPELLPVAPEPLPA
jgi:hypothetical protein